MGEQPSAHSQSMPAALSNRSSHVRPGLPMRSATARLQPIDTLLTEVGGGAGHPTEVSSFFSRPAGLGGATPTSFPRRGVSCASSYCAGPSAPRCNGCPVVHVPSGSAPTTRRQAVALKLAKVDTDATHINNNWLLMAQSVVQAFADLCLPGPSTSPLSWAPKNSMLATGLWSALPTRMAPLGKCATDRACDPGTRAPSFPQAAQT